MEKETSSLEAVVKYGLNGSPEIKGEERDYYLSVFRDQVHFYLTRQQVRKKELYEEIRRFLQRSGASLYFNGEIDFTHFKKYMELATAHRAPYRFVDDLGSTTPLGLVVASDQGSDNPPEYVNDELYRKDIPKVQ